MTEPSEDLSPETVAADWLEANREAIAASNAWVEAHGLPLRIYRLI